MDIDSNNFGSDVKKKLIDLEVSQKELAFILEISDGYLSDILRDCRYSPDMRKRIVETLDRLESGCAPHEE